MWENYFELLHMYMIEIYFLYGIFKLVALIFIVNTA